MLVKVLNNLVEILDNIGLYNSAFTGKEANCRCLDADFKKNLKKTMELEVPESQRENVKTWLHLAIVSVSLTDS